MNLITDQLIRTCLVGGDVTWLSLPQVYEAMSRDCVAAFPALRPHQRHAWHAFLAQLGVIAIHRSGELDMPANAGTWTKLLRKLTSWHKRDEAWALVSAEDSQPAFMQPPATDGLRTYKGVRPTPDSLDILVTSKNHDLKQEVANRAEADDWLFALVSLQTSGGYLGAGNYGVARMNGGYSARPCVGLAPADGGLGAHLLHDMRRMLDHRHQQLEAYQDYFRPANGKALLWTEPWDGTVSLRLRDLDPYFIEVCRRVRLVWTGSAIHARVATTKKARIEAKAANGNVGDFWTPVSKKDAKALSLSSAGFRYDKLAKLILDESEFCHSPAMKAGAKSDHEQPWRLIARGVAAGQGKTEGYHERSDIEFAQRTAKALFAQGDDRDSLAKLAEAQVEEIGEVQTALRLGIAIAATGGRSTSKSKPKKSDYARSSPWTHRLGVIADQRFFRALEERFLADEDQKPKKRCEFARVLISEAKRLLQEAIDSVPCTSIQRHRARVRGESAFWACLHSTRCVFSNQPEILEWRKEVRDAA